LRNQQLIEHKLKILYWLHVMVNLSDRVSLNKAVHLLVT
jgi:hypothetical protein